jgi:hypothetical protein
MEPADRFLSRRFQLSFNQKPEQHHINMTSAKLGVALGALASSRRIIGNGNSPARCRRNRVVL